MLVTILLFVLLLVILAIAARVIKIREIEQDNQMMQSYMMSMQEFYVGIQHRIEATRRYRHDLAKHIQTLEALLEKRAEAGGMQEYMDDLKSRYAALKNQKFCRDEIVNSVLELKETQCLEKNILLEIRVEDRIYTGVQEADMVGLLYNLLDNAIEANEKIAERENRGIWFDLKKEDGKIFLKLKNRVIPGEKITFQTQKAKKEEHGIGTRIIESLIEKYNGSREVSGDEKQGILYDSIVLCPVSDADGGENGSVEY